MNSSLKRPVLILGGMTVWLAVIVVVASQIWAAKDESSGFQLTGDRAELEAWLGTALPAEAKQVQFDSRNFLGVLVWARFEIAPGPALDDFLAALHIGELHLDSNPFIPADDRPPAWWWTPDASPIYAGASFEPLDTTPPYRITGVLADQTNPDRWTIYLRVKETT
jgi:hypothetical protein